MNAAAICNECNTTINEGASAYYDDKRELHYCSRDCFNDWCGDNAQMLAFEYFSEYVEKVDL